MKTNKKADEIKPGLLLQQAPTPQLPCVQTPLVHRQPRPDIQMCLPWGFLARRGALDCSNTPIWFGGSMTKLWAPCDWSHMEYDVCSLAVPLGPSD